MVYVGLGHHISSSPGNQKTNFLLFWNGVNVVSGVWVVGQRILAQYERWFKSVDGNPYLSIGADQ